MTDESKIDNDNCAVFVYGISTTCNKKEIYELFNKTGRIKSIFINSNPKYKDSRLTYGFINYYDNNGAKLAVEQYNNYNYKSIDMQVNFTSNKANSKTLVTSNKSELKFTFFQKNIFF